MRTVRGTGFLLPSPAADRNLSFFTHKHRTLFPHCLKLHLSELLHISRDLPAGVFTCQILVKRLCLCEGFDLKKQLPLFFKRTHLDLYYPRLVPRITYDPADKIYIKDFRQKP